MKAEKDIGRKYRLKPLVSIIIPVYNCEKYLEECLNSIIHQSYDNLEIICVDDGSTDNSLTILEQYKSRDSRFYIYTQENSFAGVARNIGFDNSHGEYILFLDSDDVFEKKMVAYLVRKAEMLNTDIIFFGFYQFKNNIKTRSMRRIPFHSRRVTSPIEHRDDLFQIAQGVPWNKFFKRDFLKETNIRFQSIKSSNDVFFSKTIATEASRILFLNKRFVYYRIGNNQSLQGNYKYESGNFAHCNNEIYTEMNRRGTYAIYRNSFIKYVLDLYIEIITRCSKRNDYNVIFDHIRESLEFMHIGSDNEILLEQPTVEIFQDILKHEYVDALVSIVSYFKKEYVAKSAVEYQIGQGLLNLFNIKKYDL